MGIFNIFKRKEKPLDNFMEKMMNSMFPKGKKDIEAGTNEVLSILDYKIDRDLAQRIFVKSVSISRVAKTFDRERLILHLKGYCLEYFDDNQIDQFYNYLNTLSIAMTIHNRTPSEVRRDGNNYFL